MHPNNTSGSQQPHAGQRKFQPQQSQPQYSYGAPAPAYAQQPQQQQQQQQYQSAPQQPAPAGMYTQHQHQQQAPPPLVTQYHQPQEYDHRQQYQHQHQQGQGKQPQAGWGNQSSQQGPAPQYIPQHQQQQVSYQAPPPMHIQSPYHQPQAGPVISSNTILSPDADQHRPNVVPRHQRHQHKNRTDTSPLNKNEQQRHANSNKLLAGQPPMEPVPEELYCNLFAAPLPKSIRNDDLLKLFAGHPAVHASVMMDVHTGRSKGFGFITFDKPEEGRAALEALNGTSHVSPNGDAFVLALSASKHKKQSSITESRHVYFRNIPTSLSHEEIQKVLGQFGTITSFHVKNDNQHRWLLASVDYSTIEEAKAAVENGHGKLLFPDHSTFPVMTKFADNQATKSARRERRVQRREEKEALRTPGAVSEDDEHHRSNSMSSSNGFGSSGFSSHVDAADIVLHQAALNSLATGESTNPLMGGGFPAPVAADYDDTRSESGSEVSTASSGKYRRNPYGENVTVAVE